MCLNYMTKGVPAKYFQMNNSILRNTSIYTLKLDPNKYIDLSSNYKFKWALTIYSNEFPIYISNVQLNICIYFQLRIYTDSSF